MYEQHLQHAVDYLSIKLDTDIVKKLILANVIDYVYVCLLGHHIQYNIVSDKLSPSYCVYPCMFQQMFSLDLSLECLNSSVHFAQWK